jgi:uncharacterized protein
MERVTRSVRNSVEQPYVPDVKTKFTHILYHAFCDDGFGAALAAWRALGPDATYIPVCHGDPPPDLPSDARVAMVDFSYRRPIILDLRKRVQDLVVLDHHLTAQAELKGLDFAHFDMEKSGAHLAWNFFHPGQPLPELLAYVEDKDLWRFNLPHSKEVTAALRSYPMDFELWNSFKIEDLKLEGIALLRFQEKIVVATCKQARIEWLLGHQIPIVNATEFRSEIANRLCEMHPEYPFAAAYYDTDHGIRSWSLRSVGEFDVAAVAALLGGGGHKNASGFIETQPVPPPPSVPS